MPIIGESCNFAHNEGLFSSCKHLIPFRARSSIMQIWTLSKAAFSSWLNDYAPSMGAALAYYTMFSIAPLILIVISTAGLVFGEEAVRGEIFGQLQGLMAAAAPAPPPCS